MKKDRNTGNAQVQRQISKIRDVYESIGLPIDFETAVDLNLYLGRALELAEKEKKNSREKSYVM